VRRGVSPSRRRHVHVPSHLPTFSRRPTHHCREVGRPTHPRQSLPPGRTLGLYRGGGLRARGHVPHGVPLPCRPPYRVTWSTCHIKVVLPTHPFPPGRTLGLYRGGGLRSGAMLPLTFLPIPCHVVDMSYKSGLTNTSPAVPSTWTYTRTLEGRGFEARGHAPPGKPLPCPIPLHVVNMSYKSGRTNTSPAVPFISTYTRTIKGSSG